MSSRLTECLGIYRKKSPYLTAPSDVWSLGTILCNLISGRNPWHIASPRADSGFRLYLREGPMWLYQNLPISLGAAAILGRIFDLDPSTRITLPELRDAILALDTFYPEPEAEPASVLAPPSGKPAAAGAEQRDGPHVRFAEPAEIDITDVNRSAYARPGYREESWELRPIELSSAFSTDFLSMGADELSAAASATLAGTISSFVNDNASSHFSDEELEEVWEVAAPPPLASSPEPTCETYETGGTDTDTETDESAGPATPETFASGPPDGAPVPELALDIASAVGRSPAPSPEERDITMAKSRLGHGDKRRRARSVSRLVEGMKKIRIRA